jgi:hypothetical protein
MKEQILSLLDELDDFKKISLNLIQEKKEDLKEDDTESLQAIERNFGAILAFDYVIKSLSAIINNN